MWLQISVLISMFISISILLLFAEMSMCDMDTRNVHAHASACVCVKCIVCVSTSQFVGCIYFGVFANNIAHFHSKCGTREHTCNNSARQPSRALCSRQFASIYRYIVFNHLNCCR